MQIDARGRAAHDHTSHDKFTGILGNVGVVKGKFVDGLQYGEVLEKRQDRRYPLSHERARSRYGSRSGGIVYKAWPFDNYDEAGGHGPERPIQADKG